MPACQHPWTPSLDWLVQMKPHCRQQWSSEELIGSRDGGMVSQVIKTVHRTGGRRNHTVLSCVLTGVGVCVCLTPVTPQIRATKHTAKGKQDGPLLMSSRHRLLGGDGAMACVHMCVHELLWPPLLLHYSQFSTKHPHKCVWSYLWGDSKMSMGFHPHSLTCKHSMEHWKPLMASNGEWHHSCLVSCYFSLFLSFISVSVTFPSTKIFSYSICGD